MMILWLKQSDTWKLKQSVSCVNGGLLNNDTFIKTKWYLETKTKWYLRTVSIVVYSTMILCLKQSDNWKLNQSDTCVNGGLLNDDILIKTKWYLEIKTKWYLTNVSIVVYWMMIFWLKQKCQWWFIEWWYFD